VAGLAAQTAGQPPSASAPAGEAAQNPGDQFVPVKSLPQSQSEQLPAQTLVMVAYAFVWGVLLVYVWSVWRRLLKVEKEIHALAERLKEKGA
jgi:CcmD family protein